MTVENEYYQNMTNNELIKCMGTMALLGYKNIPFDIADNPDSLVVYGRNGVVDYNIVTEKYSVRGGVSGAGVNRMIEICTTHMNESEIEKTNVVYLDKKSSEYLDSIYK
jgi:hypothetical protein